VTRRWHHEQQTEQMWCLTLAANAIVCWSTEYHGLGVPALRRRAAVGVLAENTDGGPS
jgi:hypothetical protein